MYFFLSCVYLKTRLYFRRHFEIFFLDTKWRHYFDQFFCSFVIFFFFFQCHSPIFLLTFLLIFFLSVIFQKKKKKRTSIQTEPFVMIVFPVCFCNFVTFLRHSFFFFFKLSSLISSLFQPITIGVKFTNSYYSSLNTLYDESFFNISNAFFISLLYSSPFLSFYIFSIIQ